MGFISTFCTLITMTLLTGFPILMISCFLTNLLLLFKYILFVFEKFIQHVLNLFIYLPNYSKIYPILYSPTISAFVSFCGYC